MSNKRYTLKQQRAIARLVRKVQRLAADYRATYVNRKRTGKPGSAWRIAVRAIRSGALQYEVTKVDLLCGSGPRQLRVWV